MTKRQPLDDVSIGKFDILATYAYARALLDGMTDDEAKQRGMVAAIMGAQARLGIRKEHHEEFQSQKEAAEKKKKTTITAESFDKQVAHRMGGFFDREECLRCCRSISLAIVVPFVRGSEAVGARIAAATYPARSTSDQEMLSMQPDIAETLVEDFERGLLSRRQLASRLMGLGAALSVMPYVAKASQGEGSTFQATGLDHVALNVSSVPRSRDFYIKHLGLKVIRDGGEDNCFLGSGDDFFLTLFNGERPGLNHYCYAVRGYAADQAEEKLKAAGLKPRREGNRVYFPDPDGIEVQVAGS